MMNHSLLKNHQKETRLFRLRLLFLLLFCFLLGFTLIGRFVFLQVFQYQYFSTQSINNEIVPQPIRPKRGLIFDRGKMLIANNTPVFSLVVIPNKVDDIQNMLQEMGKIIPLTTADIEQFNLQLKQHRRFEQIPLKLQLSPEQVAIFSVNQYHFPGVSIQTDLLRSYPLRNVYAHVLGYVGRMNEQDLRTVDSSNYAATNFIGKVGIEKYYENKLHGSVGYQKVEIDASGKTVRTLDRISPKPGQNLYLTLDTSLQMAAMTALKDFRGAVVAIQPATGQVLAMVSQPAYDPNLFVNGISQKDFSTLQKNPDFPLYSRAIRGLYAPGSTIKPLFALEGLNSKIITPQYTISDPGFYELPNSSHIFHDWKPGGHGRIDLKNAIIQSCDTYFYNLAHMMGIDRLDEILGEFGFGQPTQIDLSEELSGNIPTPDWKARARGLPWYPGDTVQSGIGQGYIQVSPLQLAVATATIANHGRRFKPYILSAIQNPGEEIIEQNPTELEPVILNNPNYWDMVINAMHGVVTQGTAGVHFGKPNYPVAAKTGTAQVYKIQKNTGQEIPDRLRDNALFIAFAPINNPQIAIAVVTEHNNAAAAVARKVMDEYLIAEHYLTPPETTDHAH